MSEKMEEPAIKADVEIAENKYCSEEQQHARAHLREKYLRLLTSIVGKDCEFQMYENINLKAQFGGSDGNAEHFYVKELVTPIGVTPEAILRTNDIISMTIHYNDSQPEPIEDA